MDQFYKLNNTHAAEDLQLETTGSEILLYLKQLDTQASKEGKYMSILLSIQATKNVFPSERKRNCTFWKTAINTIEITLF